MADLLEFSRRMDRRAKRIGKVVSNIMKEAAIVVVNEVADRTPADEGTAISNWQASVGKPKTGSIEAHIGGSKGSTKDANVRITQRIAFVVIKNQKVFNSIFISNNLHYIEDLNRGTSTQAPQMFVQIAIRKALSKVKRVRVLR